MDPGRPNERQREVLETAQDLGSFPYPREGNAHEVAAALDIEASSFGEDLAAAQSKLRSELAGHG